MAKKLPRSVQRARAQAAVPLAQDLLETFLKPAKVSCSNKLCKSKGAIQACPECGSGLVAPVRDATRLSAAKLALEVAGVGPIARRKDETHADDKKGLSDWRSGFLGWLKEQADQKEIVAEALDALPDEERKELIWVRAKKFQVKAS